MTEEKAEDRSLSAMNDPLYDELVTLRKDGLKSGIAERLALPVLSEIARRACPGIEDETERWKATIKMAAALAEETEALETLWGANADYVVSLDSRIKKAMLLIDVKSKTKTSYERSHRKRFALELRARLRELDEGIAKAKDAAETKDLSHFSFPDFMDEQANKLGRLMQSPEDAEESKSPRDQLMVARTYRPSRWGNLPFFLAVAVVLALVVLGLSHTI